MFDVFMNFTVSTVLDRIWIFRPENRILHYLRGCYMIFGISYVPSLIPIYMGNEDFQSYSSIAHNAN